MTRSSCLPRAAGVAFVLLAQAASLAQAPRATLVTESERSGFVRTGRYAEVPQLNTAFVKAFPGAVRAFTFGTSAEGRPLHAMAVSRSGALTAAAARQRGLPIVLVQGGIHAGEIDGKDAGYLILREMLEGQVGRGVLDKVVVVFVPVYNADGHEQFGKWNRPSQRGPEQMGRRNTAQNINLNRDYVKADAPETQAMLRLFDEWDPIVYTDLHVTNGSKFEHDVSLQIEPLHLGDAEMGKAGLALRDAVLAKLAAQGSMPLPYYPELIRQDEPESGFEQTVYQPRFSTSYPALRNRFSLLLETHSWKEYAVRVRVTRNYILDLLEEAATHGKAWMATAKAADERAAALAGQEVPLDWKNTDVSRLVEFRGYAYTYSPSPITGRVLIKYDESQPQIWKVPLFDQVTPALSARLPAGGYLVLPAFADSVARLLELHGIGYTRLNAAKPPVGVEAFHPTKVQFAPTPNEGRQQASVEGRWAAEQRALPAGSLFVPSAQRAARLIAVLFEPLASDSLLSWGQFNPAIAASAYLGAYVAEDIALEQLKDPAISAEFTRRLRDPAFANNPRERIAFFARRHESFDPDNGMYPVLRLATAP
ncbi:MAG: M14 family zinc carboxypeptidase [Steroidobacteraceae bacterium]